MAINICIFYCSDSTFYICNCIFPGLTHYEWLIIKIVKGGENIGKPINCVKLYYNVCWNNSSEIQRWNIRI